MIKKFLLLFLLIFGFVYAKTQSIELLADKADKKGDIIIASGNVVAYSQDYFLTANKAIYNQKAQILELFGNVNAIKTKKEVMRTGYLKLNLANDNIDTNATFLMDQEGEIWTQSNETCSDDEYYRTKDSTISSCNIENPDWHITYTSGKMNKESKFVHVFNPVFYIKNVPVLYLPYFGFPTDKTRRTGLLIPEFGYIKNEGIYYKQPIYFAPYKSWDFELNPQIRSKRGVGLYGIFRFAESPYSYGELRGGIFDNKKRAQERLKYKNNVHRGLEFEYDRTKLAGYLLSGDFRENLWINYKYVKDLEYFDLKQRDGVDDDDDSLVTSKMNYYITSDEHYGGIYARYYIDTEKLSGYNVYKNKTTTQELPSLQYHKFTNSLFLPNLTYNIDLNYHNYTRKLGVSANQYEVSAPLSFTTSILNNWINFKFSENFYATRIDYEDNYIYDNGKLEQKKHDNYSNHYHSIGLSTDLAKAYEKYFHTMTFETNYIEPGYQHGKINERLLKKYYYDDNKDKISNSKLENIKNNALYEDNFLSELSKDYTQRNISARFTEYLFEENGRKFIRHAVNTRYDFKDEEFGNLEHKLDFYFKNGFSMGNKISYSFENDSLEKSQSYIRYSNDLLSTAISHNYEHVASYTDSSNNDYDKENYVKFSTNFNLPNYYKLFGAVEYDLQNSYTKMWRLGITGNRKCWNYSLVYQEDIEPRTTSKHSATKAEKERGLYLFINFYPFGGVHANASQTDDERHKNAY